MDIDRVRKITEKVLPRVAILVVILLVFPIAYRVTRALTVLGVLSLWAGALVVWWRHRLVRTALLAMLALLVALLALPGRPVSPSALRDDYGKALRLYDQARYVWGGENPLGIDCSGLVRKGLAWGQILNGVRTVNGTPIRNGISLWWHDCSAMALRDGYQGLTRPLGQAESVNDANTAMLHSGDLAVTADGVHTMVYVGAGTWAEADPDVRKVVRVTVPTGNHWFTVPVVLVRWTVLDDREPGHPAPGGGIPR